MKVHFLNVRTMHHSTHSGYDRFMDFIPHTPLLSSQQWETMPEDERKRAYEEAKAQISWYNPPDLEMETNANALNPWFHKHVCHFLYGENSVFHIKKSQNPKKKIFVSFHQPPQAHQQFIRTREPLKAIDGIVVVSTNQIPFFEQYVDRSKILFIPHGVDTDFFRPDDSVPKDPNRILFVGNWLRDFDTLVAVSKILTDKAPQVKIDVVTLERNKPLFNGCDNVRFFSGIPEEDLLRKYQQATLLLVPMKDCTANNSVLEGMACGLPVITTDIGGIRDYVNEECAILCQPGDADGMADRLMQLLGDHACKKEMGKAANRKSEEFTWHRVSRIMLSAYNVSF
ncbi:MAG: glycosyltransferase family 4 protein [Desulfuromonadales bacterium]|nr:glycosyltransferase family 4 protein [Desulfuromonadales bacterium]